MKSNCCDAEMFWHRTANGRYVALCSECGHRCESKFIPDDCRGRIRPEECLERPYWWDHKWV